MEENQQKGRSPMTPEEIKVFKENMVKHWEAEIPFLEKQKQYEALCTDIEELRMRQAYAMRKTADIMAPPPEDPDADKDNSQIAKERKLKKTEV